MSWPPLQTLFVIVVTSVAANHQGANCDCESQGPWQPLFKPSQILHSEFPEHHHSSSTGGPKPSKYHHYKLVPHIVVPLVNPVALTIHHQNDNHIDSDEQYKYKTKGNYNKNKIKEVHYHYNFPDPDVSKYNSPSSTSTPVDDTYINNNHQEDHRNEETYPEEEANHDHHAYNENSHNSHEEEESYNYGDNPTEEGASGHSYNSPTHDQYYQPKEKPAYNPYYGSGEQNDAVYDASKLVPGYEVKPSDYPTFQNTQQESEKQYKDHFHPNKIDAREKTRGKSMYIPVYRISQPSNMINTHLPSSLPFKVQESSTEKPLAPPTVPPSYHPNQHNLPIEVLKNHFQRHRIPMHPLVHPPFSMYSPWRFLMKDEGRRMILMRPPAPGLPDTWTATQGHHSNSNHPQIAPSKLKMTGVIYPIKNFQV